MPVRRVTDEDGTVQVELMDDTGAIVPEVAAFLRHLAARDYSPNTLLAYAHDLQHLWRFLASAGLTWSHLKPPHALDLLAYLRTVPSVHLVQRLGLTLTTTQDGLHTTLVQKLSLTYYTHNLPFAQRHLAQPAGQPAIVHHR